jgi:para-aminobenzoate synthetase component I
LKKTISCNFKISNNTLIKIAYYFSGCVGNTLLLSPEGQKGKSFLFLFPKLAISLIGNKKSYLKHLSFENRIFEKDKWEALKKNIHFNKDDKTPEFVGYFNYGMNDENISNHAFFQKCCVVFCLDHTLKKTSIYIDDKNIYHLSSFQKKYIHLFSDKRNIETFIYSLAEIPSFNFKKNEIKIIQKEEKEKYLNKIIKIQDLIKKGDVYEVNLSHETLIEKKVNSLLLFYELFKKNPSPYSVYCNFLDFDLICISPERLLKKENDFLFTKPIKGTTKKFENKRQDQLSLQKLKNSSKEKAELAMILDLWRNDLNKISENGSVEVIEPFHSESYSNVHHMMSIIKSRAKKDINSIDIIKNCFPGGSITGCPKLASKEVIKCLEKRSRSVYTGSIGYFSNDGDFDFNIAIRCLIKKKNIISIQLGGAIVLDSNCEDEYLETLHKGKTFFDVLGVKL